MKKIPVVTTREMYLGYCRIIRAFYYLEVGVHGDPWADVWFDFDSKEIEFGIKPSNGVYLGMFREFAEPGGVKQRVYYDVFEELEKSGVIEVEETPGDLEEWESPYKKYALAMERDLAEQNPDNWKFLCFCVDHNFDEGHFINDTVLFLKTSPYTVDKLVCTMSRMGRIPPDKASQADFTTLAAMFDYELYLTKRLAQRVAIPFFKKYYLDISDAAREKCKTVFSPENLTSPEAGLWRSFEIMQMQSELKQRLDEERPTIRLNRLWNDWVVKERDAPYDDDFPVDCGLVNDAINSFIRVADAPCVLEHYGVPYGMLTRHLWAKVRSWEGKYRWDRRPFNESDDDE